MIKEEQTDNHRLAEETDTSIAVSIEGTTACNTPAVQQIEQKIFVVRGQQVILDRDLAILYDVETAQLNRQVKRNIQRFPEDFMFQLTKEEFDSLKCQNGISKTKGGDVAMRRFFISHAQIFQRLDHLDRKQLENEQKFEKIFAMFEANQPLRQGIFYDGESYDAYTFVSDRIRDAKTRIVLIDNYVDDTILTMLDKRADKVTAEIYTMQVSKVFQLDIDKHNLQYAPIFVKTFKKAHDRFLIIDDKVYHFGASIKDLGKRWFAVSLLTEYTPEELLKRL